MWGPSAYVLAGPGLPPASKKEAIGSTPTVKPDDFELPIRIIVAKGSRRARSRKQGDARALATAVVDMDPSAR